MTQPIESTYQPQMMTLEDAVSKFCTFVEDWPELRVDTAAYNRHGVALFGVEQGGGYIYCWGSPQCSQVERVRAICSSLRDGGSSQANTNSGIPSFNYKFPSSYYLNREIAQPIHLESNEILDLIQTRKVIRRQQEQEETRKSGLEIVDQTNSIATVVLLSDLSKRQGVNFFLVRMNGKKLIYPISSRASGNGSITFRLQASQKITFDKLPGDIVKITEVDARSTNTWYVDTSKPADKNAYDVHDHLPKPMTEIEALRQIINSDIGPLFHVERAGYNRHGTALIVEDLVTDLFTLFYASPQATAVVQLPLYKFENVNRSPGALLHAKSKNGFVNFRAEIVQRVCTLHLNAESATELEAQKINATQLVKRIDALIAVLSYPKELATVIAEYSEQTLEEQKKDATEKVYDMVVGSIKELTPENDLISKIARLITTYARA